MFIKKFTTVFICLLFLQVGFGQKTWSLTKCIQYAQQNSLSVKQGQNQVEQAQLSKQEALYSRYPTVNSSLRGGLNFGRTIDPTTNSFISETVLTSSLGVDAGVTLYNGGRIRNQIKQSQINVDIAEADNEQIKNDLALNVAAAYLQILLDQEQLTNANNRLVQTQAQLTQTDRLIRAGTLPEADRLEIQANLARDEQNIVTQQNAVEISYLNLKNLMQINPDEDIKIEKIDEINIPVNANPDAVALTQVYNRAIANQPFIKADQARLSSADLDTEIAKSLGLPVITLFGNINSFYSNKVPDINNVTNEGTIRIGDPQIVVIDGTNSDLQFFQTVGRTFGKRGYFNQLNDNFGQSLGLNVSIPIYNQARTRLAKERAQLNILNTQIAAQQNKQQLKVDIQRAIANARANKKQFEASEKTVSALDLAYLNTEKRYKLGAVNTFEYTTAKNNLDQAAIDLIIAKYNYLYSLQVLDFYQGKRLELK